MTNMPLHVIGVRHHSPACARRVERVIRAVRPKYVLIEGPADARIDELRLPHTPPVALFTWYRSAAQTFSCWAPFCQHSPEWVALQTGHAVGATVRFIDLPAWNKAFLGVRNRYADQQDRASAMIAHLCQRYAVDDLDALWDHLFEGPQPDDALDRKLDAYFVALRGDTPGGDRDGPREAYMARHIGAALAEGGDVVVVCGGWHMPPLREVQPGGAVPEVEPPADPDAACGTWLVPWSFRRLDAFTGYEAGMPSPAWYDTLWVNGPEHAAEQLLMQVATQLRKRKQPVSTADLIACRSMALALARLRGHPVPQRVDVLDGIAGALVKDGLEVPLPWSRRGKLLARTDPMLVEVVAVFSGNVEGRLAPGTPRPPLLLDVQELLRAHGLEPTPARGVRVKGERAQLLHRLRVLGVPGFVLQQGPTDPTAAELEQQWSLAPDPGAESRLIEVAAYGPTLEGAAARCLEERLIAARTLAEKAALLQDAIFVGVTTLAQAVLDEVAAHISAESDLNVVGEVLRQTLALWRYGALLQAQGAAQLRVVIERAFAQALWLIEGVMGPTQPADAGQIRCMIALRDAARLNDRLSLPDPLGVMVRRSTDPDAPPALRGAALGCAWSLGASDADHAIAAIKASAIPTILGDFLVGLFALARDEVVRVPDLPLVINTLLQDLSAHDFLVALPALRLAFSWFPPTERFRIAQVVAAHYGLGSARDLLIATVSPEDVQRGLRLEAAVSARAARYGIGGAS